MYVGEDIFADTWAELCKSKGWKKVAVVTDKNVKLLHGEYYSVLSGHASEGGGLPSAVVIPAGEASKGKERLFEVLEHFAACELTRSDVVVAFGGGVVGDLAGFAAACYMRGVPFVQVPTTLLSAVDSSVGGKTGINLEAGKNLAGAFWQPAAVICDTHFLRTISDEVYKDGCAEMIKHGIIEDAGLFASYKTPICEQYEEAIARNVQIKASIVMEDEFEKGKRMLLNFGHTVGHAIEKLSGYKISHGAAVAAGMAIETRAAHKLCLCGNEVVTDVIEMLGLYGLPTSTKFSAKDLAKAALADKKRDGGSITIPLPARVGECVLYKVNVDELEGFIAKGL